MNEVGASGTPSRSLGRYSIERTLARGGMGEVAVGRIVGARGWTRPVVIKRVLDHLRDDPETVTRFLDEARIAASLNHANIVQVFDLADHEDELFLVMELVEGVDLRRLLRARSGDGAALPPALAAHVAAELCAALDYAHERCDASGRRLGIVHRDISPSNVLLSRAGEVKLADFGIAAARSRLNATRTGQLRGKLAYMSPEQAAGEAADARSDVFSVGVLLYEMLAGERPFKGESEVETLASVQRGVFEPLAALAPDADPALCEVVERALAHDPAARTETARELERALRPFAPVDARGELAQLVAEAELAQPARQTSGARSLDDLLLAQLDAAESSASRPPLPTSVSRTGRRAVVPDHTLTRAAAPRRRRRTQPVLLAIVLLLALGAIAASWPWPARLTATSNPDGASVYVDGQPIGVTTLVTRVAPGAHEITWRLDGYAPESQPFEVHRGRPIELSAALRPADRPIEFHSVPPGATVTVGDVSVAAGNAIDVPVGVPVRVRMELEGYATIEENVTFAPDVRIFTRRLAVDPTARTTGGGPPAAEEATATPDGTSPSPRGEPRPARPTSPTTGPVAGTPVGAGTPVTDGSSNAEVAAARGTLVVRFVAPPMVGDIEIDGAPRGRNSDLRANFDLAAGSHRVVVRNPDVAAAFSTTVDVAADAETTVTVAWPTGPEAP
ncbi:MAG: protein kinase [Myxococcales bacterium]|nr:protein kinase [Myxococcales bacterium]MCB9532007.1 protein kinase [Myxococcales bacterium]MCB9533847.1 protein kinase [Myxococcales bacterium]